MAEQLSHHAHQDGEPEMRPSARLRRGVAAIREASGASGFAPEPTGTTLLDHALAYAASLRWPVFPCKPDKTPYTRHGFKDATTDAEQIRAWWERWPDASIGLPTGLAGGVYVVDVDEGHEGTANWQERAGLSGLDRARRRCCSGGIPLQRRSPLPSVPS